MKWFTDFLAPPVFPDREQTRAAGVLHKTLLASFGIGVALTAFSFLGMARNPLRAASIVSLFALLSLGCLVLTREGWLRTASATFSISIWCILTATMVFFGGVDSPSYAAYIVVCVLVGFLSGGRAAIVYTVVTAITMFAVLVIQERGGLPPPISEPYPVNLWLINSMSLVLVAILISIALRSLDTSLARAERNEAQAKAATREVEAGRKLLETRVQQQAAVAELGQLALGDASPGGLIDQALQSVANTLGLTFVTLLEKLPEEDAFVLRAGVGLGEARMGMEELLPATTQTGYTLRTGKPVIVEDIHHETRFAIDQRLLDRGMVSSASVVVPGSPSSFGILIVHADRPRHFSEDDIHFLRTIANLIAQVMRRTATEYALRESERQLRQSQKMEAVGSLAGGIAHDFNNLLTVIHSYTQLVIDELDEREASHEGLGEVLRATDQAALLTRKLLAFSRQDVPRPEILDLNETVRELERMIGRIIGGHIELTLELAPDLPTVEIDPGQIEQMILNLSINARDAMPQGGRLIVSTREVQESAPKSTGDTVVGIPMRCVCLSISDTGCGMDAETQARIFEPFFTTKDPLQGTGLGLSTVYGIASQAGGKIEVHSEEGRGSVFEIILPASAEEVPVRTRELEPTTDPACEPATETILLAEDDPRIRKLLRGALKAQGYRVLVAEDGQAGLDLAEEHEEAIDLLLTDIVMPKLSGTQLATALQEKRPGIRTILMSGYAEGSATQSTPLPQHDAFINKPFKLAKLVSCVRSVLDRT